MTTKRTHPRDLTAEEADALVAAFDGRDGDHEVADAAMLSERRAAAAARRAADDRIEAAALAAHRAGLSWAAIGAQLGMSRQGARQRFERLANR